MLSRRYSPARGSIPRRPHDRAAPAPHVGLVRRGVVPDVRAPRISHRLPPGPPAGCLSWPHSALPVHSSRENCRRCHASSRRIGLGIAGTVLSANTSSRHAGLTPRPDMRLAHSRPEAHYVGPARSRRLDEPVAVSLEHLVPEDHFSHHLEAQFDLSFVRSGRRSCMPSEVVPLATRSSSSSCSP